MRYKVRQGVCLENILDEWYLLCTSDVTELWSNMVKVDDVSAFLFKLLWQQPVREKVLAIISEKYAIPEADSDELLEMFYETYYRLGYLTMLSEEET